MRRPRRLLLIAAALAAVAGGVSACGEEGITVEPADQAAAALFDEHCAACHTLDVAGAQGSSTNVRTREYKDGPNFNQRKETKECILYAIRNGGFSSGPMPQNIVTGPEAEAIAEFIAKYSGQAGAATPADCPAG